jgi:hypothetical protein
MKPECTFMCLELLAAERCSEELQPIDIEFLNIHYSPMYA